MKAWRHVWLLALLLAGNAAAHERERILDFRSSINIDAGGGMVVTEDIRVLALGDQINHGIYRDFPTDYKDSHGNPVNVGFELLRTQLDGHDEPYHTESLSNGVRIYLGRREASVSPGEHHYRIQYQTRRQIGFFGTHDELYWNVTGNGWLFAIDHASATIRLPRAVPVEQMSAEAYTGFKGAKGKSWTARVDDPGAADFETTAALAPGQGLTVVVSFPKGIVEQPRVPYQYRFWAMALGSLLLVCLVHYLLWAGVGRDPEGRAIYPRYEPPAGLSPALLRTVWRHGYDMKCFTADLVDMAARGVISIVHDPHDGLLGRLMSSGEEWRLRLIKAAPDLPDSEGVLFEGLPLEGGMNFSRQYRQEVSDAYSAHRTLLRGKLPAYFKANSLAVAPGILVSVVTVLAMFWTGYRVWTEAALIAIAITQVLCSLLAGRVAVAVVERMPVYFADRSPVRGMLYGVAAAGIGAAILVLVWRGYSASLGSAMGALLTGLAALHGLFAVLMKAYTVKGRDLLDQIEGLRLYMSVAEKTDLEREKAPPLDAARYQALMPYAIALDVEEAWSRKLTLVAGQDVIDSVPSSGIFSHGMSNDFGSFSSAASSCTTPPPSASSSSDYSGSSSGSGGGGSSGGGGGGGGGGGW